jgi:hypothetical protein
VNLTARSESDGRDLICGRGRTREGERALISGPGVLATEGEGALTEWVQRQKGNRRLQGSEGVRVFRSRSNGGGPKGVQTGPSGSEPFNLNRMREIRPGRMSGCRWR